MESIRELLEQLVKRIVPYPEEVSIACEPGAKTLLFKVSCTQRNFAFLLGSKGRTIDSLRVLANVISSKEVNMRSVIEVPFYRPGSTGTGSESGSGAGSDMKSAAAV